MIVKEKDLNKVLSKMAQLKEFISIKDCSYREERDQLLIDISLTCGEMAEYNDDTEGYILTVIMLGMYEDVEPNNIVKALKLLGVKIIEKEEHGANVSEIERILRDNKIDFD